MKEWNGINQYNDKLRPILIIRFYLARTQTNIKTIEWFLISQIQYTYTQTHL